MGVLRWVEVVDPCLTVVPPPRILGSDWGITIACGGPKRWFLVHLGGLFLGIAGGEGRGDVGLVSRFLYLSVDCFPG